MSFFLALTVSFASCLECAGQGKTKTQPATKEQEVEIRKLIDQLVFKDEESPDSIPVRPGVRKRNNEAEYRKQYEQCQDAFRKLSGFKELALPFLVEHLGDERPSIPFRNHYPNFSVGAACTWNIYFQLQDRPHDYSSYGLVRKGRDGEMHVKPEWERSGTPFETFHFVWNIQTWLESFWEGTQFLAFYPDMDIQGWLEKNKKLSYPEKQIKCLEWLLAKEKAIGACDEESYFENILPLEIRILERKQETGADVGKELARLRDVLKNKIVSEIPAELLPDKPAVVATTNAPSRVVIGHETNQPATKP